MGKTLAKSTLAWLLVLPLAILNGALREMLLLPLLGAAALPLSGALLAGMVLLVCCLLLPRLVPAASRVAYVVMGPLWMVLTVAFEFALGFATGEELAVMLAAYDLRTGNPWSLVVLFIGFAPWLSAKLRKRI